MQAATGIVAMMHEEHAALRPHLDHLQHAAGGMATLPDEDVRRSLQALAAFLRDHLLAHAAVEEAHLYPVVERLLRSIGGGTRTMIRDHRAITEKVEAIERLAAGVQSGPAVDAVERAEGARLLYGLAALLEAHFAKEEEVYLPLLEQGLTPGEAEALADRLQGRGPEA